MQFKMKIMKKLSFSLLLINLSLSLFAQNISYKIPDGYEGEISRDDYKTLVDLAVPIVAKRYTIDFIEDGAIQLKKGQEMQSFNLHNLITKCVAERDKSQWNRIIQMHFEMIFSAIDEGKKIDPNNYETVKNYLSLRIYPNEMVDQRGGHSSFVARTDLEGTYTLLMLDLPGAFTPVMKQVFEIWSLDTATVFEVAQENINKQEIEKVIESFDFDSSKIEMIFLGSEDYAASYALDLMNNSPELVGEWGSVVAMPNKGLVNICKISRDKPVDFVKFIQMTKPFIEKSFQEHAQPISDQYFWYYKGQFKRINVMINPDGSINVVAPVGLAELMTREE